MAIARASQSAFDMFGEEVILTEEFLSKDFRSGSLFWSRSNQQSVPLRK